MKIKWSNICRVFLSAVFAGISISIGVMVYCNCTDKIVGAVLFSLGLISVFLFNFNLYTGKVGYVTKKSVFYILMVLVGNSVGSCMSLIIPYNKAIDIVNAKLQIPLFDVFVRAIICGIIIFLCVEAYKQFKLWYALIGVPVFILGGAEHSIADIGFMIAAREFSWYALLFILIVILGNAVGSILSYRTVLYINKNSA